MIEKKGEGRAPLREARPWAFLDFGKRHALLAREDNGAQGRGDCDDFSAIVAEVMVRARRISENPSAVALHVFKIDELQF